MSSLLRISPLRVLAILIVVVMGIWTIATRQLFTTPGDSLIQHIPARTFSASMYLQGRFPLWNPYEDSGIPHAALVQPGAFYPPNVVLYAIFRPALAYNLSLVFHCLLLAFFMRRYLQSISLSGHAVAFGAVTFTLSMFMHNGFVATFNAAVWIPAVFYCVEKWIQTGLALQRLGWRMRGNAVVGRLATVAFALRVLCCDLWNGCTWGGPQPCTISPRFRDALRSHSVPGVAASGLDLGF